MPVYQHGPPPAIDGSVHDPHALAHAHKRTSINEPVGPISLSSVTEHDLSHQSSSYSNGHYAQSTTYTHSLMPPPHNRATNSTAYRQPPTWDRYLPSPHDSGVVPSLRNYQEYPAHLSRTHGDGFSGPSIWSSPAGRLDAYGSPTITQSSYPAKRTSIPNNPPATLDSSSYPSGPNFATYGRPEFPSACPQWPPQPTAAHGPIMPHPQAFRQCTASQTIHIHNIHRCLTCYIPHFTHQYRTQTRYIRT
ncbi:hypothetical protein BJV77DRAFT_1066573 [Russula vinacea]|nr:hypothetical protein BJV77DRAFT_1066573 [Russula vinacea]